MALRWSSGGTQDPLGALFVAAASPAPAQLDAGGGPGGASAGGGGAAGGCVAFEPRRASAAASLRLPAGR